MIPDRTPPRLTVDDLIRRGIVDALAEVFNTPGLIGDLLDRVRFPIHQRPQLGGLSPQTHWRELCRLIEEGVTAGGLEALLAAAAPLRPHNRVFAPWLHWQEPPPESSTFSIGRQLVPSLLPLLDALTLSRQEMVAAYRRCAPPSWEPPPAAADTFVLLQHCAESLADAPVQSINGQVPLLCFVRSFLGHADRGRADPLRAWCERAAECLGVVQIPSEPPPPTGSAEASLLVQITPSRFTAGAYHVKAWLRGTGQPACLLAGEETHARTELPVVVEGLWRKLDNEGFLGDLAWVEFILPRELLCLDVDRWDMPGDIVGPLGMDLRVVVRSLERQRPTHRYRRAFLARWQVLQRLLGEVCRVGTSALAEELRGCKVLGLGEGHRGGVALKGLLNTLPDMVCVVCGQAPEPVPANVQADVLLALIETGVPVALWVRREAADATPAACAELLRDLERVALGGLPDHVRALRNEAVSKNDPGHRGWHTTLMWDDPTRLSPDHAPDQQLRPPQPAR